MNVLIVLLLAVLAGAGVFIRRRNRVELVNPAEFILSLPASGDIANRWPPMDGVANFRDLGGYQTQDGRRVRTGRVYRSGALHRLSENDQTFLNTIALKCVCDLRSAEEVALEPDRLPNNPAYVHLPLVVDDSRDRRERLFALLFNRRGLARMLPEFYTRTMLDENAHIYGLLFKRLAQPDALPAIIHCTAGKDRTGIAAALLLSVLGVQDETLLADYSLSNRYYDDYFRYGQKLVAPVAWLGIRAEHLQPLLIANPANLQYALDHLRRKYGSVESYLLTAAGLTPSDLEALRTALLE
jgi:protein-tyrosine phosphatase